MHRFYNKLKEDVKELNNKEVPLDKDGNQYQL
jgi:hypothetical protein